MPEIFNMIQDAPFSAFAESIRAIKLAIDLNQSGTGCKIIGLTSSIPNEGKSSIAVVTCPANGTDWRKDVAG